MKAITFNLLAWVMLPIMDGFAKYLSADLPVLQITWARYFFTVSFTLPIMFFFFRQNLVWTDKPKLQFIRGLILLCANICFFYAISVISMAKALTLALRIFQDSTQSVHQNGWGIHFVKDLSHDWQTAKHCPHIPPALEGGGNFLPVFQSNCALRGPAACATCGRRPHARA